VLRQGLLFTSDSNTAGSRVSSLGITSSSGTGVTLLKTCPLRFQLQTPILSSNEHTNSTCPSNEGSRLGGLFYTSWCRPA
jgi:hypothetical protein